MKKFKFALFAFMVSMMAFTFASCSDDDEVKDVSVTGVTITPQTLELKEGTTGTLTAAIAPANATKKTVSWTSSDEKVATVDKNGVVTGLKKGTATITVKTSGGKKATCKVTVKAAKQTVKVKLNKTKVTLAKGKTVTLKATVTPSSANEKLTWSSSNKKVATVSKKGKVKAIKKGTATITVKTSSGKKATCKVTVK